MLHHFLIPKFKVFLQIFNFEMVNYLLIPMFIKSPKLNLNTMFRILISLLTNLIFCYCILKQILIPHNELKTLTKTLLSHVIRVNNNHRV